MIDAGSCLPWFAVRVRTKHENSVARLLAGKGYEFFLPTQVCRRHRSDRIKNVETPLFPGYLFCRFDPLYRLPILKTPGVIEVAGYNRVPVPIEESELAPIRSLVSAGLPNHPWPFLAVGDRVRITAGALKGHEGFLVGFKGGYRLVLSVTLLQRAVAVEIDSASVESSQSRSTTRVEIQKHLEPVAIAV